MHFTGKERDAESNLDYFVARHYGSSIGRFMSPDSLQPSSSNPLLLQQFLADPQNWNKYAYSLNSPVKDTDPGGHFSGDDHERMQMNAMLNRGYGHAAAFVAATANRNMDNTANVKSGVWLLHNFTSDSFQNRENPQHGERGQHQTLEEAQRRANNFMNSKISNAATNALYGDVHGALSDIGQASHTAQDIVRHNFEQPSQHGWGEAAATPAEDKAATQASERVLDQFAEQVFAQGLQLGLSFNQCIAIIQSVQNVEDIPGTTPDQNIACAEGGCWGFPNPQHLPQ
jgi:RHS repeat-associated protein